jgi:glycosyltransferase involved in cell wall biosynthesis
MTADALTVDLQTSVEQPLDVTSGRRPKLLFVAYHFPPVEAIASVRTGNIAKHLARLGWDVTVLCPDPLLFRRIRNIELSARKLQEWGVRCLKTGHRWKFLSNGDLKPPRSWALLLAGKMGRCMMRAIHAEPIIGWFSPAKRACAALRAEDVDIVLSSGPPWTTFCVAGHVARRLRRPLCMDYRDLWTTSPHSDLYSSNRHCRCELALLDDCEAVTAISSSMADCLAETPGVSGKLHVVTNGFDAEDLQDVKPADFGHFAIVYVGQLYPPKRVLDPLLAAMKRLETLRPDPHWRLHCYGPDGAEIRAAADRLGVGGRVTDHGVIPSSEAMAAVRGAGAAVVVTSIFDHGSPADLGIVTGKVFEAIGLGTPVLAIAPQGADLRAILDTTGRANVFQGSDVEGMAAYLAELMAGKTPPAKHPETFAWPNLARKMDAVFRQLLRKQEPVRLTE